MVGIFSPRAFLSLSTSDSFFVARIYLLLYTLLLVSGSFSSAVLIDWILLVVLHSPFCVCPSSALVLLICFAHMFCSYRSVVFPPSILLLCSFSSVVLLARLIHLYVPCIHTFLTDTHNPTRPIARVNCSLFPSLFRSPFHSLRA